MTASSSLVTRYSLWGAFVGAVALAAASLATPAHEVTGEPTGTIRSLVVFVLSGGITGAIAGRLHEWSARSRVWHFARWSTAGIAGGTTVGFTSWMRTSLLSDLLLGCLIGSFIGLGLGLAIGDNSTDSMT